MRRRILGVIGAAMAAPAIMLAQQGPTSATYITAEQVKAVNAAPGTDRTLEVFDMGKYAMSVAIIHRGPTAAAARGAAAAAPAAAAAGRGAAPAPVPCGERMQTVPPGAAPGAIAHDQTTETYIITSGGGTLITGGHIVNGNRSAPDSDVTRILNGPSCSGATAGADVVKKIVKVGDIIVIPAGVPHGWTGIADHVDYLSVRPDPDKVLQKGYIHPAMATAK